MSLDQAITIEKLFDWRIHWLTCEIDVIEHRIKLAFQPNSHVLRLTHEDVFPYFDKLVKDLNEIELKLDRVVHETCLMMSNGIYAHQFYKMLEEKPSEKYKTYLSRWDEVSLLLAHTFLDANNRQVRISIARFDDIRLGHARKLSKEEKCQVTN